MFNIFTQYAISYFNIIIIESKQITDHHFQPKKFTAKPVIYYFRHVLPKSSIRKFQSCNHIMLS